MNWSTLLQRPGFYRREDGVVCSRIRSTYGVQDRDPVEHSKRGTDNQVVAKQAHVTVQSIFVGNEWRPLGNEGYK